MTYTQKTNAMTRAGMDDLLRSYRKAALRLQKAMLCSGAGDPNEAAKIANETLGKLSTPRPIAKIPTLEYVGDGGQPNRPCCSPPLGPSTAHRAGAEQPEGAGQPAPRRKNLDEMERDRQEILMQLSARTEKKDRWFWQMVVDKVVNVNRYPRNHLIDRVETIYDLRKEERQKQYRNSLTNEIARAKAVPITRFVKVGRNRMARCPLHEDRTPSFRVSADATLFYCFGCHAKGDVISFIRKRDGLSFKEAVEYLNGL